MYMKKKIQMHMNIEELSMWVADYRASRIRINEAHESVWDTAQLLQFMFKMEFVFASTGLTKVIQCYPANGKKKDLETVLQDIHKDATMQVKFNDM